MTIRYSEDNLREFINNYNDCNPPLNLEALAKLFSSFISTLKKYTNSHDRHFDWNKTIVQLEYTIETDSNNNETIFIKDDPESEDEIYIKNIIEKNYLQVFKTITKGLVLVMENNKPKHQYPPEIIEKLKSLPEDKKFEEITQLFNIDPVIITPVKNIPGIIVVFHPLVIDNDKKYYNITLNIECGNFKPARWKEEVRNKIWEDLEKYITQTLLEKDLNPASAIPIPLPNAKLKSFSHDNRPIKTSLHTELQKFGSTPKKQGSLFDLLPKSLDDEVNKDIFEYRIEVVGIDDTKGQNQALFAIQKLLNDTGYKGNIDGKTLSREDNSFKFMGYLPMMKFTPSQFLEAYGIGKRETARGRWEYNANERVEALKALRELSMKKYLFFYKRKHWKDGKEVYDLITTVRSLFNIVEGYESLDKAEVELIQGSKRTSEVEEKLGFIVIEPCPLLIDQIDTYFVLKPANYYQEIKLLVGRTSRHATLFIDYLIAEVTKKEIAAKGNDINWTIELNYETLAYKLRMNKYLETKQVKRIRKELEKCYDLAKQLGYLLEYETVSGKTKELEKLVLNPDKFRRIKEIDEEIKKIDSKIKF